MSNVLSVYLSDHHALNSTVDYIARLQPAWVRIHQPSARAIWRVQQAAPEARIMLRSWDIDDHNGDRKREAYADPVKAARDHLFRWDGLLDALMRELDRNGWDCDESLWYLGLVNEPDPNYLPQIVEYTAEAMRVSQSWPLGVMVPSVGNFGIPGKDPNDWSLVKPLEKAIRAGGHILMVHEYWQPEGPNCVWIDQAGNRRSDAGYLAWRHRHIPMDVPILIGESGANGFIYNRHSSSDDAGWGKFMSPEQYAAQVQEYIAGCDSRVQGVCLYMTDYHSDQWHTFDTTPAHEQLLSIKDTRPAGQPPHTVHIPAVVVQPVAPEVHPSPHGSNWERSLAFVRRMEGGWADNPADPGGATMYGITLGTFIRWRQTHGQGMPSKEDLRAITDAEANRIYWEWYWQASGADKMAWPMCLAHFDLAVNGGVGRAYEAYAAAGHDFLRYMAWRLRWYTRIEGWPVFGAAWVRRCAELLDAAR